jgi:hypothetical protein
VNAVVVLPVGTRVKFLVDILLDPPHNITIAKGSEGTIRNATTSVYFVEPDGHPQLQVMVAHGSVEPI